MGGGGGQKTLAQSAFGGKDKEQKCVNYLHGVQSEIGVPDIFNFLRKISKNFKKKISAISKVNQYKTEFSKENLGRETCVGHTKYFQLKINIKNN